MARLDDINYISAMDIIKMLEGLTEEQLEVVLAEKFRFLSPDAKQRILGLSNSGLSIVTGSCVPLNTQVSINIQNASGFDAEAVFKALVDYRKSSCESKTVST
ncbi:hypothetical protein [Nodularia sphaerocarpa]|uniref:hypothetical protein n=1 Tax=Nodularia sphaerocarpa TaxID=137816 RepID=UPI00232D0957|nr:hypothetical protein [Nodularia sphaerocarpa]MDB9372372.1 hypothetical protein [Nodularia sphaerocarpa CS-585]MDB9377988.1 hypothetical protein [Nodularia sphaerocarpa CS-585A2]